ncbi:PHP domain-containing protein [Vulcanisaeta souniana]|uniref:Phosphoesterase n=1 Tax=Vulcanisaeta souniana JCM 11219 TaxID=1293586 RepID=A0A830EDX1_9CREN|nr:PHP domain-containing protein [Vulcanisaeta souniana]BDR92147.1 phosphoesterase [Vulcanisaeta souniana JCM 11219]GGI67598.1 phosphoesterase [Vulcanisaeta souniana JCM 11219]
MTLPVKADLHTHTVYSDGRGEPRDVIKNALDRGIGILSITDHDTFKGSLKALEFLKNNHKQGSNDELIFIIGNEVRTRRGDVLVLCRDYPGNDDIPRTIPDLLDWVSGNNCVAIPAHPYDALRHGIGDDARKYRWHAIEVFNAGALPIFNWMAKRTARELGLPGVADSDAHVPELVGVAYTVFELDDLSVESVFRALINGRVKAMAHYPGPGLLIKRFSWSIRRRLR